MHVAHNLQLPFELIPGLLQVMAALAEGKV